MASLVDVARTFGVDPTTIGRLQALSFREARPPREAMRPSITERAGRN
jgi:hypothetical protein